MASTLNNILLCFIITIFFVTANTTTSGTRVARAPFKPNAVFLATQRDDATSLHITNIRKRTPQVSVPLIVDLNGRFLWVVCDQNYVSSTYHAPICHSTQCSSAGVHYCHKCSSSGPRPGCHNNTCAVVTTNPLTRRNAISELAQDVVSIHPISSNTTGQHQWATIPHFAFACAPSSLLQGRPHPPAGVQGIAGLGHTPVALPLQIASRLGLTPKFSMCLGSPDNRIPNKGGIIFGRMPSIVRQHNFSYTPLTIGAQGEYFILVKNVTINYQPVPFNTSLLSTTRGFTGTMISTTTPHTVLEHSVYKAFIQSFAHEMSGTPQVEAIPPFGLCYNSRYLPPTRVGAPNIEFFLYNNVSWKISGYTALLQVRPNVCCFRFIDGGTNVRAPITFGSFMLENNILHFDLLRSRLGFSPWVLQTPMVDCSDFNYSTTTDHNTMQMDDVMGD